MYKRIPKPNSGNFKDIFRKWRRAMELASPGDVLECPTVPDSNSYEDFTHVTIKMDFDNEQTEKPNTDADGCFTR